MKPEQEHICSMVTDTILLLCKNGLSFGKGLKIQGLLGITVDDSEVFLIQICESFQANEDFAANGDEHSLVPFSASDSVGSNFYQREPSRGYNARKSCKFAGTQRSVKLKDRGQGHCVDNDNVIMIKDEVEDEFSPVAEFPTRTSMGFDDFSHSGELNGPGILQNSPNFPPNFTDVGPDGKCRGDGFGVFNNNNQFASVESSSAEYSKSVKEERDYDVDDFQYGQNSCDTNYLPKSQNIRQSVSRRDRAFAKSRSEKYQPAKSIVSKYRQQQHQQMQQGSSPYVVVKSLHECGYPNCGKQFRHKQHLLRHQTQKHGRLPTKFLSVQNVWNRTDGCDLGFDAEQFDPGAVYE